MNKKGLMLIGFAKGANLPLTEKAINLGFKLHKGQKRNDGRDYIDHPLETCLMLVNNGVRDDVTLAASVSHDFFEDTEMTYGKFINLLNKEVADLVDSLTKKKGVRIEDYFSQIKDPREVLIKVGDRTHNMNDMAKCFTVERLKKYVGETEMYILPMIKKTRREYPEYASALISMKVNIEGILIATKRIISEADKALKMAAKNKQLEERIKKIKRR